MINSNTINVSQNTAKKNAPDDYIAGLLNPTSEEFARKIAQQTNQT